MRKPRLVKEETRNGETIFVVYDGEEDEKMIGSSPDRETALEMILIPYRDGDKRKVKRR